MKIKVDTTSLDKFISGLTDFSGNIDDIADELLNEQGDKVASAYAANVQASAGRGYSTGAAAGSISPTEARMNAYGHFIAARPTGTDAKGTRNAEKMAYLEYGTSKQAARPFMSKTVSQLQGIEEEMKSQIEAKAAEYCGE